MIKPIPDKHGKHHSDYADEERRNPYRIASVPEQQMPCRQKLRREFWRGWTYGVIWSIVEILAFNAVYWSVWFWRKQ